MKRDPPVFRQPANRCPPLDEECFRVVTVRAAGVEAVSPAQRGRSAATRLDAGEHTVTLPGPTARLVVARWLRALGIRRARSGAISGLPSCRRPVCGSASRQRPTRPVTAGVHTAAAHEHAAGGAGLHTFSQKVLDRIISPAWSDPPCPSGCLIRPLRAVRPPEGQKASSGPGTAA